MTGHFVYIFNTVIIRVHPDRKLVQKLNVYHRMGRFDKDASNHNEKKMIQHWTFPEAHLFCSSKSLLAILSNLKNLRHVSIRDPIDNSVVNDFIDELMGRTT